jgi:hypothetical protein
MSYEIFRQDGQDGVLWRATAATLDQARAKISALAIHEPGPYIILNTATGNKTYYRAGGDAEPARAAVSPNGGASQGVRVSGAAGSSNGSAAIPPSAETE